MDGSTQWLYRIYVGLKLSPKPFKKINYFKGEPVLRTGRDALTYPSPNVILRVHNIRQYSFDTL